MSANQQCPACGAPWPEGHTCEDDFHQMLFWEAEFPEYGAAVHHLLVVCYFLQHPHLYSPEGVKEGRRLLSDFLDRGLSPQKVRQDMRERVASDKRDWNISGKKVPGSYSLPVHWTMRAADVVAGGSDHYVESVKAWARSIHQALQTIPNP